jgi:hypothetical protein
MMWKFPKVAIGLGVVILAGVFLFGQGNLWSGVSSWALNVKPDRSPGEGISPQRASGTGGSISCCRGSGRADDTSSISESERVKQLVYEEYAKKLNDPAITVEVNDLGCHIEALVMKDGKALKHLSVSEGVIQEID